MNKKRPLRTVDILTTFLKVDVEHVFYKFSGYFKKISF